MGQFSTNDLKYLLLNKMESSACEDLKAFERRLTELVASYHPSTLRWRIVLAAISICTAIGAWYWLRDPKTSVVPLTESLFNHPLFFFATLLLIVLAVISICTAIGAWYWLRDPKTSVVPLTESLFNHPLFFFATLLLIILFMFGIHKLVIAPQIITSRMRLVLSDFNMSCDDTGKLILKPRPNNK